MDGDVVSQTRSLLINHFFQVLGFTVLYYDYALTFLDEFMRIWKRPKTAAAWWFIINRYVAVLGNVVCIVTTIMPLSGESCQIFGLYRQFILVVSQVLVGVVLTIRVYGLYNRSKFVLGFLIVFGALCVGTSCFFVVAKAEPAPPTLIAGCHPQLSNEAGFHIAMAWWAMFVYDSAIFTLTVWKTWSGRVGHRLGSVPLLTLVLRDGAMYYAIMAMATFSNIVSFYIGDPLTKGCLSTFASSVSVSMASRLTLNLHQSADPRYRDTHTSITHGDTTTTGSCDRPGAIFTTQLGTFIDMDMDSMHIYEGELRRSEFELRERTITSPNV